MRPAPFGLLNVLGGLRSLATIVCVMLISGACRAATPPAGPDRLVYIGTYTGGTTGSQGIYAFRFDEATGALTAQGLAAETPSPSFLTARADGRVVFAVNELASYQGGKHGSVTSFAVDPATAKLTAISVQDSQGADPCHLMLDRTGRFLAVANYTGGNFALFPVAADGRIGAASTVVAGQGRGPTDRQEGPHGHHVWFTPDNRFLIATDLGIDQVLVYRFDATSGSLTPNQPPSVAASPGAGPRHTAFHPDGRRAFVINELNSTITSLAWDGRTGTFTAGGSVPTRPAGVTTGDTAEIHVHPNGTFVYGSNRGDDSIAVFRIGDDAALTLVEHESTRGKTPRNFEIDPTGRWLIAANQDSHSLAVFSIDQNTGALAPVGPLVEARAPVSVLFMN